MAQSFYQIDQVDILLIVCTFFVFSKLFCFSKNNTKIVFQFKIIFTFSSLLGWSHRCKKNSDRHQELVDRNIHISNANGFFSLLRRFLLSSITDSIFTGFDQEYCLHFESTWVYPPFCVFLALLIFFLCLVWSMLPVSLGCPCLIIPSVFSKLQKQKGVLN